MFQFRVLSGTKAGAVWVARHFPVQIGRGGDADFRLDQEDVASRHALIRLERDQCFVLEPHEGANTSINGESVAITAPLRNGDVIGFGSQSVEFRLTDTVLQGGDLRDALVWVGIALVCVLQVILIYRI